MIVVTGTITTSVVINVTTAMITTAPVERSSSDDLLVPVWTDYNDYDGYLICDRVKHLLSIQVLSSINDASAVLTAILMWHVLPTIINALQEKK